MASSQCARAAASMAGKRLCAHVHAVQVARSAGRQGCRLSRDTVLPPDPSSVAQHGSACCCNCASTRLPRCHAVEFWCLHPLRLPSPPPCPLQASAPVAGQGVQHILQFLSRAKLRVHTVHVCWPVPMVAARGGSKGGRAGRQGARQRAGAGSGMKQAVAGGAGLSCMLWFTHPPWL